VIELVLVFQREREKQTERVSTIRTVVIRERPHDKVKNRNSWTTLLVLILAPVFALGAGDLAKMADLQEWQCYCVGLNVDGETRGTRDSWGTRR